MNLFVCKFNSFPLKAIYSLIFFCLFTVILNASVENHLLVLRNNSIVFDAAEGIDSHPVIKEILVEEEPFFGNLEINGDYTMTFEPYRDICEEKDNFTYLILSEAGFDTINVRVDIICEKLTVLSGFSPNGDGVNDTFTIIGAEFYPNNSLVIFNKWGEEVYATINYQNTWDGTDKNNDSLVSEESVYYYVFDDGEGKTYSGYMKIE